jgi:hypothetical protein
MLAIFLAWRPSTNNIARPVVSPLVFGQARAEICGKFFRRRQLAPCELEAEENSEVSETGILKLNSM